MPDIGPILAAIGFPIMAFLFGQATWIGFRTGVLPGRKGSFARDEAPLKFYLVMIAYSVMFPAMLLGSVKAISQASGWPF